MTQTSDLGNLFQILRKYVLKIYQETAAKNQKAVSVHRQAIFYQAVSILCTYFHITFSLKQLSKMRHISFRNGVLVVPIGELETGTPNVTKLEFYISPAERMIFLSRQNSQKTTRLHVIIDPGSTTHRGYKVEVLKLITKGNEQQVVVVEKYAILSQNGHFLVGNNFPNRDYDIGELVAKICYRRNEA